MVNFYKELIDLRIISDLMGMLSLTGKQVTPQSIVVSQVISIIMCPMYGDTFTFPWKRGPLDTIAEYFEAANQFELTRHHINDCLFGIDWIGDMITIFNSENESK